MFKIVTKKKDYPLVGTYFKIEQRYYKVHAYDKTAKYVHIYGDMYTRNEVGEQFGTTLEDWVRRYKEGKYVIVPESEVPERVLNYKLQKTYNV